MATRGRPVDRRVLNLEQDGLAPKPSLRRLGKETENPGRHDTAPAEPRPRERCTNATQGKDSSCVLAPFTLLTTCQPSEPSNRE